MSQFTYNFTHSLGANLVWVLPHATEFYMLTQLALKILMKTVTFS